MPDVKGIAEDRWMEFLSPKDLEEDVIDLIERGNLSPEKRVEKLEDEVRLLQKHVKTLAKAILELQKNQKA